MVEITKIQIAECGLSLPRVLRLGPVEIRTRDYVVLRVETREGTFGEAIGYPRGTPLFETLSNMARRILGADACMRRRVVFNLEQSNIPARAALTRGLSMIDIAEILIIRGGKRLICSNCSSCGIYAFANLHVHRRDKSTNLILQSKRP